MAEILLIDDDINLGMALQMTLQREGHDCRLAQDAESGWGECQARIPDLALLDLQLPDSDGLSLLSRMREQGIDVPVIIMTAFGTVTSAVSAMKRGAADFIEKPLSVKEVCQLVVELLSKQELARQIASQAQRSLADDEDEPLIIGECPQIREALAMARRIAALPPESGIGLAATLIVGETGTGKEMVARYIHAQGLNPDGPFIQVNCTAIPDSLFEVEHFGHEKGVFTDAKTSRQGLLEAADGGTLFLDEVGDMPLKAQAKLLIAIETGRFRRIGSTREQQVTMRVIAASNTDLAAKVQAGEFRSDLYHRLKLFEISLPPLHQRGNDVLILAHHFIDRFCASLNRPKATLTDEAEAALRQYPWPGNVRELAHLLLRALVHEDSDRINPEALGLTDRPAAASDQSLRTEPTTGAEAPAQVLRFDFSRGTLPLAEVEKKLLQAALDHAQGSVTEAARLLHMTRGTFRYRLEKLGLI